MWIKLCTVQNKGSLKGFSLSHHPVAIVLPSHGRRPCRKTSVFLPKQVSSWGRSALAFLGIRNRSVPFGLCVPSLVLQTDTPYVFSKRFYKVLRWRWNITSLYSLSYNISLRLMWQRNGQRNWPLALWRKRLINGYYIPVLPSSSENVSWTRLSDSTKILYKDNSPWRKGAEVRITQEYYFKLCLDPD